MVSLIKRGLEIVLDNDRALYIPQYGLLVISDFHLGKSGHFRREGLQIPSAVSQRDIMRLDGLVQRYDPQVLLVTGDMFHHQHNVDLEEFRVWRQYNRHLEIILVKGNHDKLQASYYDELLIQLYLNQYEIGEFCFVHDSKDAPDNGLFVFSGHLHPGVLLKGSARQKMRLACFVFDENTALLPAFSLFTGLYMITAKRGQQIFAVTESLVMPVNMF
ncbi:ligase-associated DNA damage response endonuclease PdeM [Sphingobacterium sp. SG20118]|uniref:ligase-associated DNA damage response endonuclease PdeM n=1 Tax=Sphingobacterium sp. SG20118 TaxID=3367156 RepID=UPI0037DFC9DE